MNAAIVLSGGSGKRMHTEIPKQYMDLCGRPLITYSLEAFENSFIDEIILVCGSGDEGYCKTELVDHYGYRKVKAIVPGGKERYHSVAAGIRALSPDTEYVFIHDGARPFLTEAILKRAYDCVRECDACVVGMPSKDTVKIVNAEHVVQDTPKRDLVWQIQTPQVFAYRLIRDAYEDLLREEERLLAEGVTITDDAMAVELMSGHEVRVAEGSYTNIKVTTPEDLVSAQLFLERYGAGD